MLNSRCHGTVLATLCLGASLTAQATSPAPTLPPVLVPHQGAIPAAATAWVAAERARNPAMVQSSFVRIHSHNLRSAGVGHSLALTLGGKPEVFAITDIKSVLGYHVAVGKVQGRPGDAIFVLSEVGIGYASIHLVEESYAVVYAGAQDLHVLQVLDDSRRTLPCKAIPVMTRPTPSPKTAASSTDTLLDCAVFYTQAARQAAGNTYAVEAVIVGGMEQANVTNRAASVQAEFRLVYTGEVNYTEDGTGNDLSRFRNTRDGHMDGVHALRNTYGADLMHLITAPARLSYCGVAYLMTNNSTGFAPNAFGVTVLSCISGNTMAHEFGHNIGCHHDRNNAGGAIFPHAYGFRTGDSRYRTVMSYSPGSRVNTWSSPGVTYRGYTMGVANSEDNARTITRTKGTVERFRAAKAVTFCQLNGEIPGFFGAAPKVRGWGTVNTPFSPKIEFSSYRYFAQGFLVIGATPLNLPYFGGILVPSPHVIAPLAGSQYPLILDASALSTLPGGSSFWFQGFFLDSSAVQGMSASNGVKLIMP